MGARFPISKKQNEKRKQRRDSYDILLFENAVFYIQKKEFLRWLEVLALSESYDTLKISISYDSIDRLVKLSHQGKLILLDGDVDNLFCMPLTEIWNVY